MKILHVFSRNLDIFSEAVEGTSCRINGSCDITYLSRSLQDYNARDVLGLVIFVKTLTKKLVKLISQFDELFFFNPKPIVVACENAEALYAASAFSVHNSPLFLVNTVDGTISDTDLRQIMATVCCLSGDIYDLSSLGSLIKSKLVEQEMESVDEDTLSRDVLKELEDLRCVYEDLCQSKSGASGKAPFKVRG